MAWKNRGKKGKNKPTKSLKKRKLRQNHMAEMDDSGSKALKLDVEYLHQWSEYAKGNSVDWKFNKTRQSHLLRSWPSRNRLPSTAFKDFLLYLGKLPENCRKRTIEQAHNEARLAEEGEREAQAEAEAEAAAATCDEVERAGDEDGHDGKLEAIEKRIAECKIQHARALKVLQVLLGDS